MCQSFPRQYLQFEKTIKVKELGNAIFQNLLLEMVPISSFGMISSSRLGSYMKNMAIESFMMLQVVWMKVGQHAAWW